MSIFRLLIACKDNKGLVAGISHLIAKYDGNINEAHHHLDTSNEQFFMRNEIKFNLHNCDIDKFKDELIKFTKQHHMDWKLIDASKLKRILIMGSKSSHCVADLLHRHHEQELSGKIIGVLSNSKRLAELSNWYQIPFEYQTTNNPSDIIKMSDAICSFNPDVIVLARYMQIIPDNICQAYNGKIINIHHSFLPSFSGANPYKKAHEKGVKLIGATCHFVTKILDEGPIIEQDTVRINHTDSVDKMQKMGHDIEKITLAKGLQYYLEDRVIIHNNKTIVFN